MKKLIKQLKQKDLCALEHVMDLYSAQVYFLIKRIVGKIATNEDIEEIVSDVFFYLWHHADQYGETRDELQKFIVLNARAHALNCKHRDENKAKNKDLNQALDLPQPYDTVTHLTTIENNRFIEQLMHQLNQLKEPDKTYFLMRYFFYYDLNTIATTFKCSVKSVESSLNRSRNQFKQNIKKEGYYE